MIPQNLSKEELEELKRITQSLRRLAKVNKDQAQLGGSKGSLLKNVREDSTVTSRIDTNGTITGRFVSSKINMAQIPAQQEFRELFSAPTYYHVDDNLYKELLGYS